MHITPATLVCMAVIEQGVLYLNRDLTVADAPLGAPLSGREIKSCMGIKKPSVQYIALPSHVLCHPPSIKSDSLHCMH